MPVASRYRTLTTKGEVTPMAATQTVAQQFPSCKPSPGSPFSEHESSIQYSEIRPRHGVITLSGYGISARVDRGHLLLEDGVGTDRRRCRLPRVDHDLTRLVVIGSDGQVSLAALRWLADQDSAFVMLDRDGEVLITTGPVRSYDARLRRAQAMALHNGTAFRLSREIIDRKLAGQERVVLQKLGDEHAALAIRQYRSELAEVESIDEVRVIEARAAKIYWSAWRTVTITFPRKDLLRVPAHWRFFGSRVSSITGSTRLATNPVNAILNYLYAVLEAEARLAAATLGLDPGIGVLHVDTIRRDSLACDLMEPIRPDIDAFVLDWLKREPLSRNAFFEQRDGNCRLMDSIASKLSPTAATWARLVSPTVEWFAKEIYDAPRPLRSRTPTRLTQLYRREVKSAAPLPKVERAPRPDRVCLNCGNDLKGDKTYCKRCGEQISTERMPSVARLGRVAAQKPAAQVKRSATQKINARARYDWKLSDQPTWLTEQFYWNQIQPRLASTSGTVIARTLNVSRVYANHIRKGRLPHPRHWQALANLADCFRESQ
jgi:CRISPR-associated endonuclease Cas1